MTTQIFLHTTFLLFMCYLWVFVLTTNSLFAFLSETSFPFDVQSIQLLDSSIENSQQVVVSMIQDELYILNSEACSLDSLLRNRLYAVYNISVGSKSIRQKCYIPMELYDGRLHFTNLFVWDAQLLVVELSNVFVFALDNDSTWIYSKHIPLSYTFYRSFLSKDSLILWTDVFVSNHPPDCKFYKTSLNLTTMLEGPLVSFTLPINSELAYVQPRRTIDCSRSKCITSDFTDYSIIVHDNGTSKIDTIKRHPASWFPVDHDLKLSVDSLSPKESFPTLTNRLRDFSTIANISIFNDSIILVVWLTPGTNNGSNSSVYYADAWYFANDRWTLVDSSFRTFPPMPGARFDLFGSWLTPGSIKSGDFMLDIIKYPGKTISQTSWDSRSQYLQKCDEYALDYNPKFVVIIKKIKSL